MSTIVEATVPVTQFALSRTLADVSDSEFEVVSLSHDRGALLFAYVRGRSDGDDRIRDALETDPTTSAVEVLSEDEGGTLFRFRLTPFPGAVADLLDAEGTVLDADLDGEACSLRILLRDDAATATTLSGLDAAAVSVDRVFEDSGLYPGTDFGLTQNQYDTIRTAFEAGYYDVPRDATLQDLAAILSVSHQALSERLRRGHRTLIGRTLQASDDRRRST